MSSPTISERARTYLDTNFAGSTFEDGYYFILFRAPVTWRMSDGAVQQVGERIAEPGTWLIAVGVDPRPYVSARDVEEQTIVCNPDWDVHQRLPKWFFELETAGLALRSLLDAETVAGAVALVNAHRGVLFDANMRRLYGQSESMVDIPLSNGTD